MDEVLNEKVINDQPIDILLVEDNEADIKITLRAFSRGKLKNNIFVVHNGQEALDFVRRQGKYKNNEAIPRPDLILLDIKMPKMDGFQVLDTLKKDAAYAMIPVVMLTSSKSDEDVVKSYRTGAASYIPKPVNYDDFVKAIEGFNFYWHIINKLPDGKRGV